ncbi:MAG: tetratricopeptide repeat protein, partial [Scytonema sp. PMC 1069.18]|nr:tetratricopeptide repeat protein [Scytonema sp. PMC 1069.18]
MTCTREDGTESVRKQTLPTQPKNQVAKNSLEVSELLQIAVQYQRANRLVEAEQQYRRILEKNSNHPEALYGLGVLAQQKGQLQTSEQLLSAALQVQPDSVKIWFSLGNLRLAQEQFQEAAIAYRQALALQPDSLPINNNLGYALQQQGLFDEAINYYQKALELKPDFKEAEANLGNTLHAQGKLSNEQQLYYAQLNHNLGVARKKTGDLKTGIAYFRQAIALQPDLVEAHHNLGVTLQQQGELDEAFVCYQRVLELNSNYVEVYFNLGKIYQQQQQLDRAAGAFREWLKRINPHYAQAIETYQSAENSQEAFVTPPISLTEVTVGAYQFPAIPPVSDAEKPRPFWSVVVTVYNRTDYILECLASVLAQWSGKEEMEILVMDDASKTSLCELVNSIGRGIVRYYKNPQNLGLPGNWNAGIALSRGQWIHLLHDDDCILTGFYSKLQQSLKGCLDSVGAAFTGYENINDKGKVIFSKQVYGDYKGIAPQDWLRKIGVTNPLNMPAVVIRRETHERLGVYHPELTYTSDWELYKRIAATYDWWYEPGILARYREHSNNATTELLLSGTQMISIRRAIEISESYLPSELCADVTTKSRNLHFNYCLQSAKIPLQAGNVAGAWRMLEEALRIDWSSSTVTKLFAWLKQDQAELLRNEIVLKLISLPLSDS